MQQAYETSLGIHDYLQEAAMEQVTTDPDKKRPLSSVALHYAEDFSSASKLHEIIDLYFDLDINKTISLDKFLSMPDDIVQYILKKAQKIKKAESAIVDSMKQSLGK